ncbi:hypothetical protein ACQPXM_33790 [Kribbella sp. CA-253562]|uniref:hypothetical protein n=1 Tax=Kribbella sp. CA-253562 TaxID=3239942 RepID=UPI003D924115
MSDIERYLGRTPARQHRRALDEVHRGEIFRAERIAAKGRLVRRAVGETVLTALAVEEAARIAPSGIPEYGMIAAIGAQALIQDIMDF